MILHNFTLEKIISECGGLVGLRVSEIFSQERDHIILNFEGLDDDIFLEIATGSKYSGIFLRDSFARARKNSVNLFASLSGQYLQNIEIINNDRIIKFEFENLKLYVFLFGRGSSNIFLVDKNNLIVESFGVENNGKNNITSKQFSLPEKFNDNKNIENISDFINNQMYLGKHYLELFYDLSPEFKFLKLNNLNDIVKAKIKEKLIDFKNIILSSTHSYLYKTANGYLFSLIELTQNNNKFTEYESVSRGVAYKIFLSKRDDKFNSEFKPIFREVTRNLKKVQKNLKASIGFESSQKRESDYRHFAELLMSQENLKQAVKKNIILKDWDGSELEIKTDEKLNILQNAEKYFKKSKKARLDAENKKRMLPKLKEKNNFWEEASAEINKINETNSLKELDKFAEKYGKVLNLNKNYDQKTPAEKYRYFDIEGWDFYVGRNAKNNDELTLRFAKPNDIWFHARGTSGSHCVLKTKAKTKTPKNIIEKCAQIAAFYSGAKNAKYVHVAYALKKHVRKPKGANPGAVVLSREEVIMVEPKSQINE
jgi:predicted ribosome quality control (RQC) complex YloA/Tae2 family protein